jgi:hypothetical protein
LMVTNPPTTHMFPAERAKNPAKKRRVIASTEPSSQAGANLSFYLKNLPWRVGTHRYRIQLWWVAM